MELRDCCHYAAPIAIVAIDELVGDIFLALAQSLPRHAVRAEKNGTQFCEGWLFRGWELGRALSGYAGHECELIGTRHLQVPAEPERHFMEQAGQ